MQVVKKHNVVCEKCQGERVKKNGKETLPDGSKLQKWYCLTCNSSLTRRKHHGTPKHKENTVYPGLQFTRSGINYKVVSYKATSQALGNIWVVSGDNPGAAIWMYESSILRCGEQDDR